MRNAPMPLAFSLYLDVLRFVAAVTVMVGHLGKPPLTRPAWDTGDPVLPIIDDYGAIAVTAFFVLSGYVIAYVVAIRERDATTYAISRLSRLYSVVLPALLATWLFDSIGSAIDPVYYAEPQIFKKPPSIEGYLSSLFFVNEFQILGLHGVAPGSNGPYWSLSFEAAYYVVAGLVLFAPRYIGAVAALLLLAVAGRTIAAMAPIWAVGFALFHYRDRLDGMLRAPRLLWWISLALMIAIPSLFPKSDDMNFGIHFPWARGELNRNLAQDYAATLAVALNLVTARRLFAATSAPSAGAQKIIRQMGLTTFPLYVVHFPALAFFGVISPWPATSLANILFVGTSAFLAGIALTPFCEYLKNVLRNGLEGLRRKPPEAANPV